MKNFFQELKRRKVYGSAIAYVISAWVLLQAADILLPTFNAPQWALQGFTIALLIGFPIVLIVSWVFNFSLKGLVRDNGPDVNFSKSEKDLSLSSNIHKIDNGTSIAILPFLNISGDPENEYFSDGLTEELTNVLTQGSDLRVASRTSCFAFKNKDADITSVGKKLGVGHVLEGSVRKVANKVRITAKLVEVGTDSHLWSETYDRELDDIFAIQTDIAEKISMALKISLNPKLLDDATTTDARAYDYYLQAKRQIQLFAPEKAIESLNKAVKIDPLFIRAWTSLAQSHAFMVIYHYGGEKEQQAADEASRKALELAPQRGDVQAARGIALTAAGKFEEAALAFDQAIKLDPHSYTAYYNYARACIHEGLLEKATELFEKAAEAEPESFESLLIVDGVYDQLGQNANANKARQEGLRRAERYLQDFPNNQRAYYLSAGAMAKLGKVERAKEWASRALEIDPNDMKTRYNLGCFYAQIGELDIAMEMLESIPLEGQGSRSWAQNDPDLKPLKNLPRFKRYLESLDSSH